MKRSIQKSALMYRVKAAVLALAPNAEIILFGSRARDDAEGLSDWDLLVLLDGPRDKILEGRIKDLLYDMALETDNVLSSIVRSKAEWSSPRYAVMPIKQRIDQEGVRL